MTVNIRATILSSPTTIPTSVSAWSRILLKRITELQIRNARYANPLTLLPGNVPINEHVEHLLENYLPFTACYFDLDNFKPFNDLYGYSRGDMVIRLLGTILQSACNPQCDFIGHIGGDDFMIIFPQFGLEATLQDDSRPLRRGSDRPF